LTRDRRFLLPLWNLILAALLAGCQSTQEQGSIPSTEILPRIVRASEVTDDLWNLADSLGIRFTSSKGRILLDTVVPFHGAVHSTPSIAVPVDEGVSIEVLGLDSKGRIVWHGSTVVPPGDSPQTEKLRTSIEVRIVAGSANLDGRLEAIVPRLTEIVSHHDSIDVDLTNPYALAQIHFTLDGTEPLLSSQLASGRFRMDTLHELRARAFAGGMLPSPILDTCFGRAGPVRIAPASGVIDSTTPVVMSAAVGEEIHFTLDGSVPTQASTVYTEVIRLKRSGIVRAVAFQKGLRQSSEARVQYEFGLKVTCSIAGGTFDTVLRVALSTSAKDAEIHFTLNGIAPDASSPVYTEPIRIDSSTSLTVAAWRSDLGWSPPRTEFYRLEVQALEVSRREGNLLLRDSLVLRCPTPGVEIRYTLDGTDVTSHSNLYRSPLGFSSEQFDSTILVWAEASVPNHPAIVPSRAGPLRFHLVQGTMVDPRDGRTYPVVRIGGMVWMGRNLAWTPPGGDSSSMCYDADTAVCAKSGRLYSLAGAFGRPHPDPGCWDGDTLFQGVCPQKWHLSTLDEWDSIIVLSPRISQFLSSPWGNDSLGLSLPLAGWHSEYGIRGWGSEGQWWASTCSKLEPNMPLIHADIYLSRSTYSLYANFSSVRCVRDEH